MFPPLVSSSLVIKREILAIAAGEAARYKTTVKEVVDGFFAGRIRPGLQQQLDRAEAAAGLPPAEVMALVGQYLDANTVEPADLVILLQAHADSLPTPTQAREIVEAATRLAKRARVYERQIKAIQASHDASIVPDVAQPPALVTAAARRPVRARSVQRYSGLSKGGLR
jgi:hypothetical protein